MVIYVTGWIELFFMGLSGRQLINLYVQRQSIILWDARRELEDRQHSDLCVISHTCRPAAYRRALTSINGCRVKHPVFRLVIFDG